MSTDDGIHEQFVTPPEEMDFNNVVLLAKTKIGRHKKSAKKFRSRNFMTEEVLHVVECGERIVEVSTGMFMERRLYGITVADPYGEESRSLFTLDEVSSYLDDLAGRPANPPKPDPIPVTGIPEQAKPATE